jgi:hypothetical protein
MTGMQISQFCFRIATATALVGVSLGIYMGVADDHILGPVHAHLNLIGWVSMFLFGLYYQAHENAVGTAAKIQVGAAAVGYITMLGSLAHILLTGKMVALPFAIAGSLLIWASFLLFAIIVWSGRRSLQ